MNRLYFGDNLRWLSDRKEFPDASVDLVYLDPPFNSNADYNVLFREPSKGADRGVDGLLYYYETERKDIPGRVREEALPRGEPVHREKIIVQVKGGGVNRGDVATLLGDVENQKAAGGVLITLEKPSKQMRTETADAARYTSKLWHDKDYPRLQILTVEGLLNGSERVDAPPQLNPFAMAARERKQHEQAEML
jgi:NACHT-associated inactive restriction endonuclease